MCEQLWKLYAHVVINVFNSMCKLEMIQSVSQFYTSHLIVTNQLTFIYISTSVIIFSTIFVLVDLYISKMLECAEVFLLHFGCVSLDIEEKSGLLAKLSV